MSNQVYDITEEDYIYAKTKGISRELLYSRVWKGMPIWRARSQCVGNKNGEGLWTRWKDKSEVGQTTFYNSIKAGMKPEEAIKRKRILGPKSKRRGMLR